jgi:hypothetical protein
VPVKINEAVTFHIERLQQGGQPVPEPLLVTATYVSVAA